ncbi:Uncharacterised protein [uncultured Clostridium sp.]|nr:Uncharacterised protein [uncultured Clostridium sp.]
MRVRCQNLQIGFKALDKAFVLFNLLREVFEQLVLQTILLALVVGFHQLQAGYLHIQIHTLLDAGISGAQGFDLGKGKRRFVHIIAGTHRRFRSHDLTDEFLLILHRLPEVCVKGSFGHIAVHMDKRILVTLTLDTALALGKVSRSPRTVQVMKCHQTVLHIGACAHLGGAAQKDTHLTGTDFREQLLFPYFGVGFMDKSDLVGRHPLSNEFLTNIVIYRKDRFLLRQRHSAFQCVKQWIIQRFRRLAYRSFCLRCRNVTEHQLGQLVSFAIPPDLHDVVHALIDLCARFIRQHLVDDSLVQAQLTAIRGNLEHIVLGWVNGSAVYQRCPFRKGLDHFLLMFGRLRHDVVVFHLRGGQVQLIGSLNVGHFFEQVHQLRQVKELAESRSCPVAGAFRCQLQCCDGLSKSGSPAVEVGHVQLLQAFILKVTLHGVKLGHGVADRCAGGKNHATVSGDLIHIAALGKHIGGFLRVRCG